jgi:hypothetical protein
MVEQFLLQVSCGISSVSALYLPIVVVGSKFQQLLVFPPSTILAKTRHLQWSPPLVDLRWSFTKENLPLYDTCISLFIYIRLFSHLQCITQTVTLPMLGLPPMHACCSSSSCRFPYARFLACAHVVLPSSCYFCFCTLSFPRSSFFPLLVCCQHPLEILSLHIVQLFDINHNTVDINDNSSYQLIITSMTSSIDINDNTSMKLCPTISPFVIDGNKPTLYTVSPCDDASLF